MPDKLKINIKLHDEESLSLDDLGAPIVNEPSETDLVITRCCFNCLYYAFPKTVHDKLHGFCVVSSPVSRRGITNTIEGIERYPKRHGTNHCRYYHVRDGDSFRKHVEKWTDIQFDVHGNLLSNL